MQFHMNWTSLSIGYAQDVIRLNGTANIISLPHDEAITQIEQLGVFQNQKEIKNGEIVDV